MLVVVVVEDDGGSGRGSSTRNGSVGLAAPVATTIE